MIKKYFKNLSFFENLTDEELDYLSFWSKERHYKKDNIIVSEGNKRNFIYIVKSGKVKLYKSSKDGRQSILDIHGPDSILGLAILFNDRPNPSTVMTIEDSTVCLIKTSDLEEIMFKNPSLAINAFKIVSGRLLSTQEKIKNLTLDDSYLKVVKLLLNLSRKHGVQISKDSRKIDLNLTRSELASFIGISRETLSRTLGQLSKEDMIDINDKQVIVKCKLRECLR